MKKIYILTFHRAINYGAILQAYALKTSLQRITNHKIMIIDYTNERIKESYKLIKANSLKSLIRSFILFPFKLSQKCKFAKFTKENLVDDTQLNYTRNTLVKVTDNDLFIVGSDQVWNFALTGNDESFFLDFVSDNYKKVSYAASFGFEENFNAHKDRYLSLLSDFKEISIREVIGYNELLEMGKRPSVHIDPTLLLNKETWSKFTKKIKTKYILIFDVLKPNKLYDYAYKLAKQKGLKVIKLNADLHDLIKYRSAKKIMSGAPQDFLSLISNAEYVFTTSFHGVAFSILFQKRFFTELKCKDKYNARVENLLRNFKLEERAIEMFDGNYEKVINWKLVGETLDIEREKSFVYLKRITDI